MIPYKIKYKDFICTLYIPENPVKRIAKTIILLPGLPASSDISKIDYHFWAISGTIIVLIQMKHWGKLRISYYKVVE